MLVDILTREPNPTLKICELAKTWYPQIQVEKLSNNEVKRLIRKLIREKDLILQSVHVLFSIKCPIFVYNDLLKYIDKLRFRKISYDFEDLSYEVPSDIKDIHLSQIGILFKKLKIILKDMKADNVEDKDLIYLLPMSSMVSFVTYLDFLEIYDLMTRVQHSGFHEKTNELTTMIFNLMNSEFPDFFTIQTLDIFLANKEK